MKIGFYTQWNKNSPRNFFIGDHLYVESMCTELNKNKEISSAELYAPDYLPNEKLDFMIHINDNPPLKEFAEKNILYLQGSYHPGSDRVFRKLKKNNYDGYAFVSNKLFNIHKSRGGEGIFLPFGVNLNFFYPREKDPNLEFEVAYIGNNIKGEYRTNKYLLPAADFNFGLFGNWNFSKKQKLKYALMIWKPFPAYYDKFREISRGKIPQDKVPFLYSSSKINLNCTAQDSVEWDLITGRICEILACRGFAISDRTPIAEELLKGGIVFTDGGEDLKSKIKYYLKNESEREKIANIGYNHIIKNFSMKKRIEDLLRYLRSLK